MMRDNQDIKDQIKKMRDLVISNNSVVKEHINSHRFTVAAEDKAFNMYQKVYLQLNKDLHTDGENIVHL